MCETDYHTRQIYDQMSPETFPKFLNIHGVSDSEDGGFL